MTSTWALHGVDSPNGIATMISEMGYLLFQSHSMNETT